MLKIKKIKYKLIYVKYGIVFTKKDFTKYINDWYIDENYPGYMTYMYFYNIKDLINFLSKDFDLSTEEIGILENKILNNKDIDLLIKIDEEINISVFDRDEAIKNLNGEKFGLEKWKEIQKNM